MPLDRVRGLRLDACGDHRDGRRHPPCLLPSAGREFPGEFRLPLRSVRERLSDTTGRRGAYVGRILQGAKPGSCHGQSGRSLCWLCGAATTEIDSVPLRDRRSLITKPVSSGSATVLLTSPNGNQLGLSIGIVEAVRVEAAQELRSRPRKRSTTPWRVDHRRRGDEFAEICVTG